MPHNVRTSIATDPNGKITGYGISIEAMLEHGGQDEIRACIESSLDMIRQAIQEQLIAAIGHASAPTEPPATATAEQPAESVTPAAPPAPTIKPPYQPPASAEEAEQRFFARYAEIVGGESWLDVRAYLQTRSPKPTTIEGWINAAEAVRDQHHAEQYMAGTDAEPQPKEAPAPKRTQARRSARRAA